MTIALSQTIALSHRMIHTALTVSLVFLATVPAGCSSSKKSMPIELVSRSSAAYHAEAQNGDNSSLRFSSDDSNLTGHVTALRSCGYREKASLRGSARQIFVGLEKLKIRKQEYVELSGRRLYMVDADAQSEGLPIQLTTYSYKDDDCFVDYVLWVAPPKEALDVNGVVSAEFAAQLDRLRMSFGQYVGEAAAS